MRRVPPVSILRPGNHYRWRHYSPALGLLLPLLFYLSSPKGICFFFCSCYCFCSCCCLCSCGCLSVCHPRRGSASPQNNIKLHNRASANAPKGASHTSPGQNSPDESQDSAGMTPWVSIPKIPSGLKGRLIPLPTQEFSPENAGVHNPDSCAARTQRSEQHSNPSERRRPAAQKAKR